MAAVGIATPSELARRMKVNRQTVHLWLTGQRAKLTPEMLYRLVDVLNVSARWLAFGPPYSPVRPVQMDPTRHELISIFEALDDQAKEQWLSSGRTMVRLTAKASINNPFPVKVK